MRLPRAVVYDAAFDSKQRIVSGTSRHSQVWQMVIKPVERTTVDHDDGYYNDEQHTVQLQQRIDDLECTKSRFKNRRLMN